MSAALKKFWDEDGPLMAYACFLMFYYGILFAAFSGDLGRFLEGR